MPPRGRTRKLEPVLPAASVSGDPEVQALLLAEKIVYDQVCDIKSYTYAEYCDSLLGLRLTEGQAAISRVLYDGKAPEEKFVDSIFGGLREAPSPFALRIACIVAGRGSGKTSALLAARGLHLALTVDLSSMTPNDPPALVAVVAPDMRQSKQTLGFVRKFLEDRPILKKVLKAECLQEIVRIERPDGRKVNIEARPATGGGNSVRGPVLAGVLLDESAFFEGEGYEVNDAEILRAAMPRIRMVPGAQVVFGSTPWAQEGKLYELYRDNVGKPDTAVVCRAPTLIVRPNDETRQAYEAELKQDPDNAKREYDAEFLSADAERFFPEAVIVNSVDSDLQPPIGVFTGERCRFGADFAFASDSSALVGFVERDGSYVCIELDEQRPKPGLPLVPSRICQRFAERLTACGARVLVADDHYREAIQEHLTACGIALSGTDANPAASYVVTRSLMAQGRVKIPANPRLLAQLRRVRSTMKPGGVVSIHQPRSKEGGHGDLVSAMVCALHGITVDSNQPGPAPSQRDKLLKLAEQQRTERLKANEKKQDKAEKAHVLGLGRRYGRLLKDLRRRAN